MYSGAGGKMSEVKVYKCCHIECEPDEKQKEYVSKSDYDARSGDISHLELICSIKSADIELRDRKIVKLEAKLAKADQIIRHNMGSTLNEVLISRLQNKISDCYTEDCGHTSQPECDAEISKMKAEIEGLK